ncbi:hypothetical protein [Hymenobacter latericus]|uniref:hypothetical protein n=1 Tax=Hymenobacter sp. YIM 151858-1 TaxID=2987688 RepID=UPI0022261F05|nr:hypothetical protein [Hymenobacter sp. YIM 151858-1]UYZ61199.1 hypothetical protein OIS50_19715 [Hymenobacter sp. YIM 151858-1]
MNILDVDYKLTGCVNNTPLEVIGTGLADFDNGRYEMQMQMDNVPMHWDPAFVILICCDRMLGVCAKQQGRAKNIHTLSDGFHALAWRQAGIYDEQGREVGYANASSHGHREGNTLVSRSQILTGHIHLDLLEEVTSISTPHNAMQMPFGDNMTLLTSAYSFETDHGNKYKGFTVYPYKIPLDRLQGEMISDFQLLTIENIDFSRVREKSGACTFKFEMQHSVETLQITR